jgi:hypothetical protein
MGGKYPPAGLRDWDAVEVERMREMQTTPRIAGNGYLFCAAM